ncbi:hypothetical protein BGX38DRAFT_1145658 [Terfezia claveryi]|nr:hypothetical protein BGX38DRAFT_1145658 [Terfezia claveryi]
MSFLGRNVARSASRLNHTSSRIISSAVVSPLRTASLVTRAGNKNSNKQRKLNCFTSYSNMSQDQAEARLGFRFGSLKEIPVKAMLNNNKQEGGLSLDEMKEEVYKEIVRYLRIEGSPTEANSDFKEANINHLVYAIISPILESFILRTGRENVKLLAEKKIFSKDSETGGEEEIVIVDLIQVRREDFILIVEAKRSSLGQAMKQCLLAMKDMCDNNDVGEVFGFVTTGKSWKMLKYNGASFEMSEDMLILFDRMASERQRWMDSHSIVVECIYFALSHGGMEGKGVVVEE